MAKARRKIVDTRKKETTKKSTGVSVGAGVKTIKSYTKRNKDIMKELFKD